MLSHRRSSGAFSFFLFSPPAHPPPAPGAPHLADAPAPRLHALPAQCKRSCAPLERIGRGTGIRNASPKKFRHQILPFYSTAPSGRGTGAPARLDLAVFTRAPLASQARRLAAVGAFSVFGWCTREEWEAGSSIFGRVFGVECKIRTGRGFLCVFMGKLRVRGTSVPSGVRECSVAGRKKKGAQKFL